MVAVDTACLASKRVRVTQADHTYYPSCVCIRPAHHIGAHYDDTYSQQWSDEQADAQPVTYDEWAMCLGMTG